MRVVNRLFTLLMFVVLVVSSSVAVAAAGPVAWETVDVTVHTDPSGSVLMVSGQLPESEKLPANVELAVPAGAQLQWAGEILGGSPDQDPTVKYDVAKRGEMDVYSFTLTKSRMGQIEFLDTSSVVQNGSTHQANLSWTAPTDAKSVRFSVRIPQGAQIDTPAEGATTVPGPTGYSYYQKTVAGMKAGQSESLSFAYTPTAPAPSQAQPAPASSGGDTIAVALVIGVALAVFIFLVLGVNKKMQAKNGSIESSPETAAAAVVTIKKQTAEKHAEPAIAAAPVDSARPNRKPVVILGAVVGVLGVFAVLALANGGKATVTGDMVSLNVAQVDTCTSANIALTVPQGGDLAKDAQKVLAPLKSVTGVGNATIYLSQARLEVNFCDSSTSEEVIRAALAGTGYVSASAPAQSAPASGTAVQ